MCANVSKFLMVMEMAELFENWTTFKTIVKYYTFGSGLKTIIKT
jgi:hypothetical protein